jgi:DNA-binding Xre family transcriptional regulator
MAISYKKTLNIIDELELMHKNISEATGLSGDTLAKLKKDESMTIESLEVLAKYLSRITHKRLQPGDLFEFIY